jgi:predicted thioesterase
MAFEAIQPGLRGEVTLVVAQEHTAKHMGSGSAQVLATPRMVLLMEMAGVAAVDPLLPEGYRTVGAHLDVRHLAPTPIGFEVLTTAELMAVDGRRLTFRVQARDRSPVDGASELVGEGTHTRFIIDVDDFKERAEKKAS